MEKLKLMNGNNLELLKKLEDNSVDSVVTDPPYGLSFMNKKWDYDVPSTEFWKEVLRVLKPGGHVLSFGGTKTYHRMVVNMEDAGFEIRDQIMWLYGSGFPKSHNIGKSYDKKMGNEREVIGEIKQRGSLKEDVPFQKNTSKHETEIVTKGNSPYEGWGTALKPANEPICLARKPFKGTVVDNVLKWGTGGINIDDCRISTTDTYNYKNGPKGNSFSVGKEPDGKRTEPVQMNSEGRWPANIILDEEAGKILDEQSGGTSRFFYQAKVSKKERNMGTDKNNHPTVKPVSLMTYLCRLITPKGGVVLDPFMGSGSTGISALLEGFNFIGMEMDEEYFKIAETRINNYEDYRQFIKK